MPRKQSKPQPRQRGTIVPEGDGKYRVRVYIGTDDGGKRQYVSRLSVGTISQAQRVRTALLREIDSGTLARPTGETLGEFLPRFLSDVKQNEVVAATLRGYHTQAKTHILPALGRVKLEDITPFRLQSWIAELVGKGLSYSSIRHAYVVLDMALDQAVTWGMLAKNPAAAVTLPTKLKRERAEMATFTPEQMHRFLAGIDTADARYLRYSALFHVLLYAGLRPSEAAAVRWSDLDADAGKLTVRRALTQVTSGHWEVRNYTKTSAGQRRLSLPKSVLTRLASHRQRQLIERMAAGPEWLNEDWMFTTKHGHTLMPNNMARAWRALCKHAGVPTIRLYDARHTAATLELAAGVDPKTVSSRRGHASVAFTLQTYAHVLDQMDEGAAEMMDGLMDKEAAKLTLNHASNG